MSFYPATNTSAPGAHSHQLDPTGEVNLEDPVAIGNAIRSILDGLYGNYYDSNLLAEAMRDVIAAYRGNYPGLLRCDMLYHDLRHALETGLTTARLLDGHAKSLPYGSAEQIDGTQAVLCIVLALFHDIGLLRRDTEAHLFGAVLIPIHEERGVEFMRDYLAHTRLGVHAAKARLIMATKLVFSMPDTWGWQDRRLASLIATADLLSQFSDRCYLEKCRDFLFVEFSAFGLAGNADSLYPDRETLLEKTPAFFHGIFRQRVDEEFGAVYRLLELHTGRGNPWEESIQRNLGFLEDNILPSKELSCLRRQPHAFR